MSSGEVALYAGPLRVDPDDQRAWLNGQLLDLGPKPFSLLLVLMRAAQRLVSKEELFDQVWEGRFVSEAVLTTAIRDLRRALGDDARQPRFIETAHGRGYRFLLPVEGAPLRQAAAPAEPAASSQARRVHPLLLAALSLALIGVVWVVGLNAPREAQAASASIAVLPFTDLSAERRDTYFAEGLAEEILNVLLSVDGLRVASRTSSFAFAEREALPAQAIAHELGVRYILEGTVRVDDERARICVRLIDSRSGHAAWTRTYDRELTVPDLLALQDEVARLVVGELRGQLGRGPNDHLISRSAAAGTDNMHAYELYLRARELFVARSDLPRALRFAQESVAADPRFARGWELLAATTFVTSQGRPTTEARNAVDTALRLDPNLSLAHAIHAVMGNYERPYDWEASTSELQFAVELDPTNTTALLWLAIDMHKLGYLDRAQTLLERCLDLDPAYDRCRLHLMWTLHMRGETDQAISAYHRLVRDGAAPDDAMLLLAFLERGDEASARAVAASISRDQPLPQVIFDALSDPTADRVEAQNALRAWLRDARFNQRDVSSIVLELEQYDLIQRQQGSFFALWLPEFPQYRASPHFKRFVREMGLDRYWRTHGFPPQCRAVGPRDFTCAESA